MNRPPNPFATLTDQIVPLRAGPGATAGRQPPAPRRGETALGVHTHAFEGDAASALARDLERAVRGEVRFDPGTRALYSHDASNYRQPPIGVVIPRDTDDVETTVAICRAHGAPILSRGGGTSLAGQCVNTAVVMDFSKYVNRVLDIDPAARRVRVQPGCVLDDMRRALSAHGLTYGPDPATHNHCTLGGMLGNNSCGIHSVMAEFYGPGSRTADHVHELEILTYDGLRMRVGPTTEAELEHIISQGGKKGAIYAQLRQLRDRHADEIRARYPAIPRRVSGYNLDELLPERGFNVARALVGSESTCVTILEATLEVYPDKPHRTLVVLGYDDLHTAGDDVVRIREFRPVGLEGLDERLMEDVRKTGIHAEYAGLMPSGKGWLLVEFGGDSPEESRQQAERMTSALKSRADTPSIKIMDDPEEEEHIWKVRESGLGATSFIPGQPDNWPGWEDSAVPPDRVGEYLRELRQLFDRYGYNCALYGHFGQGCIHTRIDFDLTSAEGLDRYRRFTDDAADLCLRMGGSLSGEHGDGQSRADLLVKMFGPTLVSAFRDFKRAWDPDGAMNPGKVVDAYARTDNLKLASYRPARPDTTFYFQQDNGDFRHAAMRCVGVGKCRRSGEDGGTMCPSFMVTRDEKHTTRGRARMLFEMMQGDVITDGWASDEVKDALDLCLACKGCKGDCPVSVDMATYKAEFLAHYYQHHRRPRHAYAMGWIHRWAYLGGLVPELANLVTQTPGLRHLAATAAGVTPERPIPRFAPRSFQRQFARRRARSDGRARASAERRPVILWPDTFNNYFFPRTLTAAVEVLEDAGYRVLVPRGRVCCGRALYDYGMLDLALALWQRTRDTLGRHILEGTPVVGMEPSCVAAFRDELPNLFPRAEWARRLCDQTYTLSEFLLSVDYDVPAARDKALVHGHCHHKAVLGFESEEKVLRKMGLDLTVLDSGCCGLAGSFGFEAGHYDISMEIGERVLLPAVREASSSTILVADGFSCREQIQHGTGRQAFHTSEVLAAAIEEAASFGLERPLERRAAQAPRRRIEQFETGG